MKTLSTRPLGFGLGLRPEYYTIIETEKPAVDWFEIMTEDYFVPGGRPIYHLEKIRQDYPLVMHGVALSIGGTDPLNFDYLKKVKELAEKLQPAWLSDHLCWTGVDQRVSHDLLPLPYTDEVIKHVVNRIKQVQDFLQRQILLENLSSYLTYRDSHMTEWEFFSEIATQADCKILLDINNIYVSSFNHEFDPMDYINGIPVDRVQQFHLAGHLNLGDVIIDTHDHKITEDVWQLYEHALQRFGFISTMIERDDRYPPFAQLLNELNKAKNIAKKICAESSAFKEAGKTCA